MTTPKTGFSPRFSAGQMVSAETINRTLDELEAADAASGATASLYIPTPPNDATIAALIREPAGPAWMEALQNAGSRVLRSDTGLAAFRIGEQGLAISPGFPLAVAGLFDGCHTDPVRALLSGEHTVGVALLRLGRYAIGIYRGRQLLVSKTDTRYVKGKHHAGGTSQRRFQRVRENQIHRLYAEASRVLTQQWRALEHELEYVALGGEAGTVNGFLRECDFLARLSPITLPRRLDVREPNRAALDRVGSMLYDCRVYPLQWREDILAR